MISIEQANAVHMARGNTDWAVLDDSTKAAALTKAADYFLAAYEPFLKDAEQDERYIIASALLALELNTKPITLKQDSNVKEKSLESDGNKSKTVYQDGDKALPTDPFPLITKLLAPLRLSNTTGRLSYGQMRAFV